MSELFKQHLRRFLLISAAVLVGIALLVPIILPAQLPAVLTAYLLSFLFVGSNYAVLKNMQQESEKAFIRRFFLVMAVRMVLVLAAIVVVLKTTGFHQIYFTVGFIIAYILHSVIEIITIEKLLQNQ